MQSKSFKKFLPLLFSFLFTFPAFCQVQPYLTARVDTTQQEVKAVYQLISNYFNSKPDSLYNNPYWNEEEKDFYFKQHKDNFDQAAYYLFFNMNAKHLFNFFKPTILSIEPVGEKYVTRILLSADAVQQWMKNNKINPPFILRYYAAKDKTGNWKLENTWSNELQKWKQHKTKWVTFHYPPSFEFNPATAKKANVFIDSVIATLQIKNAKPFDFYVMSSEEELGRLFNMDYWLAYNTGFTRKEYNRIFSAHGREDNLHEFVHALYHPVKNYFLGEGIATYFGGVNGHTPYQQSLLEVSKDIAKNHPEVSFKDMYTNNFRYATNQNPRYVAGAVVYQMVYAKKGLKGIKKLEKSENTYESFIKNFADVMDLEESKVEAFLKDYIREYHQKQTQPMKY
ncbi:hypothetical protein [Pontibacter harenae]|uniref:hypothetical protein n=1 Tax=Pontibacter harenae TaxID=2894083 RepID=UPI001E6381A6|nr:hypothetical protein [Pontibacter harenae]MCC9166950.1 hypothetical protein [Pontibacter harenae]